MKRSNRFFILGYNWKRDNNKGFFKFAKSSIKDTSMAKVDNLKKKNVIIREDESLKSRGVININISI